jgi:uncharacterized cupredoxin-like copper-binding protein
MPHRSTLPLAGLLSGIALLASACALPAPFARTAEEPDRPGRAASSGRPVRVPPRKPGPTWATSATVRVVMNDRFRYRPDAIMVRAGRRVTFAVTNAGKLPHEFILGDRTTQLDHERQMQAAAASGGHAHDHGPGDHAAGGGHVHDHGPGDHAAAGNGAIAVPPGETKRLTWTFDEPGIILYGCHVLGHWAAGMKGTIVVLSPDRPLPLPARSPPGR